MLLVELQNYYPERLAKCYILHMLWFFGSAWKIVSRFLEKAIQEKVLTILRPNFILQVWDFGVEFIKL